MRGALERRPQRWFSVRLVGGGGAEEVDLVLGWITKRGGVWWIHLDFEGGAVLDMPLPCGRDFLPDTLHDALAARRAALPDALARAAAKAPPRALRPLRALLDGPKNPSDPDR